MNNKRLAKLYGVKGLPFPVSNEMIYWMFRASQLGIKSTLGEFSDWYSGVVRKQSIEEMDCEK